MTVLTLISTYLTVLDALLIGSLGGALLGARPRRAGWNGQRPALKPVDSRTTRHSGLEAGRV